MTIKFKYYLAKYIKKELKDVNQTIYNFIFSEEIKDENYDYEGCFHILVNSKINWTRIINKQVNISFDFNNIFFIKIQ